MLTRHPTPPFEMSSLGSVGNLARNLEPTTKAAPPHQRYNDAAKRATNPRVEQASAPQTQPNPWPWISVSRRHKMARAAHFCVGAAAVGAWISATSSVVQPPTFSGAGQATGPPALVRVAAARAAESSARARCGRGGTGIAGSCGDRCASGSRRRTGGGWDTRVDRRASPCTLGRRFVRWRPCWPQHPAPPWQRTQPVGARLVPRAARPPLQCRWPWRAPRKSRIRPAPAAPGGSAASKGPYVVSTQ